jgi:amino acid adenylation domain-containing protein
MIDNVSIKTIFIADEIIINEANNTAVSLDTNKMLYEPILDSIDLYSNKLALIQDEIKFTYKELLSISLYYADIIVNNYQIQPGDRIAILMSKGWEQVVACLAISMAGCVFVPLSLSEAHGRLSSILEDADISLILSTTSNDFDLLDHYLTLEIVLTDKNVTSFNFPKYNYKTPAYIIYTSGTTGKPKGVIISHQSVLNTILDINRRFSIDSKKILLALSDLSFDLAIYDIFGLLCAGGCIIFPGKSKIKKPDEWLKLVLKYEVNFWNSVPAYLELLIGFCKSINHEFPSSLKLILLSGDWISLGLVRYLKKYVPFTKLISLGGATEAAIWSIYHEIDRLEPEWKSIPYGKPLANQTCFILDDSLQKLPIGTEGEIYIGGMGVGLGYLNDIDKTGAHFIKDGNNILYKTGDLGYYDNDGNIILIGRRDNQVKINGFRIETGEIEACLNNFASIEKSVVTIHRPNENGGNSLIIAHLIANELALDTEKLGEHIRENLPNHMRPHHFRLIKDMPLTINGKVDKAQLVLSFGQALMIPMNKTAVVLEKKYGNSQLNNFHVKHLMQAISQILSIDSNLINVTDTFFSLGGDSISALRLIGKLSQIGSKIDFNDILELKSISELASKMSVISQDFADKKTEKVTLEKNLNKHLVTQEQEGILFQCQYFLHPELYIGQVIAKVSELIDAKSFENIFNRVMVDNEILRRGFIFDEETESFIVQTKHLNNFKVYDNSDGNENIYSAERKRSFNVSQPPLIRCALLFDEKLFQTEIILTFHHVLLDGISCTSLINFLYTIYKNLIENRNTLCFNYQPVRQGVDENNFYIDRQEMCKYWTDVLNNYIPYAQYYPHAEKLTFDSKTFVIEISNDHLMRINDQYNLSVTELFMVAWGMMLLQYNNLQTVCFGLVMSLNSNAKRAWGFFIKTPPVLVEYNKTTANIIASIKEQLHNLPQYGEASISDIRKWKSCPYDKYLYDTILIIDTYTKSVYKSSAIDNIKTKGYTHYPLAATIFEDRDGYKLRMDFHANIFSENDIAKMEKLFVDAINFIFSFQPLFNFTSNNGNSRDLI